MLTRRHSFFAAAATVALLASTHPVLGTEPARQTGAVTTALSSSGGTFSVVLKSSPAPIPLNEPFELTVDVRLARPVDDTNPLWLAVEATMPEHAHGMNTRPRVEALPDGRFAVKGLLFHMAGEWELVLNIAKGRIHEQARTRVLIE